MDTSALRRHTSRCPDNMFVGSQSISDDVDDWDKARRKYTGDEIAFTVTNLNKVEAYVTHSYDTHIGGGWR